MKKLQIAAIAAAFAIVSTAAMAQTPAKPSDTQTPAASGTQNQMHNGMKSDMKAKDSATTGAAAQDAKRGDTEPAKTTPQTKEPAGATKNAN